MSKLVAKYDEFEESIITSFRNNFSACGVARGGKDGHQAKR